MEGSAQDELLARIADNPLLPTPPGVALQVLDKASRPSCAIDEIGAIIRMDPALCGKILKTVNSALFSIPRAVSSIDLALNMLGLKAVRSLVLSLSLPAMQPRHGGDNKSAEVWKTYWKSSVAGAIIARELAVKLKRPDPEDDLVAGLLRDLGMVILYQEYPEQYQRVLDEPAEKLARSQCVLEVQALGLNHAEVSAAVLRRWRLPRELTEAIRYHHEPDRAADLGPQVASQAALLHFVSLLADLQIAPSQPELGREIVELAQQRFAMNERDLAAFLEPLNSKIKQFAAVLNVDIGASEDYTVVLSRAVEELAALALESNLDRLRACEAKSQAEQSADRWRRVASRLRRDVIRDRLTGAYNRRFFEEALAAEFKRAQRRCGILGLVFIDVDNFKTINDRFGHPFGDQVLKAFAGALQHTVRGGDVVARYGGDEFCVIVSDTSETAIERTGRRFWEALQGLTVKHGGNVVQVQSSLGAVACFPHRGTATCEEFVQAADKAMYSAKQAGKNRVAVASLLRPEDSRQIEEVRRRLFSAYLSERGRLSEQQLREALRLVPSPRYCIGRLARRLGWMTPRKLRRVLQEQRQSRKQFGAIAVAHGYLSAAQLYTLLAIQREPPEELADSLIDLEFLSEKQARTELAAYRRMLQEMECAAVQFA